MKLKSKAKLDPYLQKILDARDKRLNAPLCKPGKHKFQVVATCGDTSKMLNCKVCSFGLDVPLDSSEIKIVMAENKEREEETTQLHSLIWKFQEEFYLYDEYTLTDDEWKAEQERVKRLNKGSKKKLFKAHRVRKTHKGFKWEGYEFMQRLDKFAEKHPEVIILGCDDVYFASSTIALIPHRSKTSYMGTTMVTVPQMGIFPPTEVFLYPSHAKDLIEALSNLYKESKDKVRNKMLKKNWTGKKIDTSIPEWFKAEGL